MTGQELSNTFCLFGVDCWRHKTCIQTINHVACRLVCSFEVLIATHYTLPGAGITRCVQIFARVNVRHCRWIRRVWISFCSLNCSSNKWRITWQKCVLHCGPPMCMLLLWAALAIRIAFIYSTFYSLMAHSVRCYSSLDGAFIWILALLQKLLYDMQLQGLVPVMSEWRDQPSYCYCKFPNFLSLQPA